MKHVSTIFFAVLMAYLATAGGHLYSPDEEILFRVTQSLYEERDLSIRALGGFATRRGTDGKEYAQYGIGQAILALPFYAVGKAIAPIGSDAQWRRLYGIPEDERDGLRDYAYSAAEIAPRFACSFFNIFIGAASAALLYLLLMQLTSHVGASALVSLAYAFGSMAWPHSRPFFTESAAVFFVLMSWWSLLKSRRCLITRWAAFAGFCAGFAALVRLDSVLLYPGLACVLLGPVRVAAMEQKPRVHPFVAFCVPAAACGVLLLLLNTIHFGGPFESGYSDQPEGVQFATPLLAGLYGFLFSVGKGLFFFSPALIPTIWSLGTLKRDKWIGGGIAVSILVPLLFMSKWLNWAGGWCWGPRHIVMIHPFLAIPIALWLVESWSAARRRFVIGATVVGIAVQLLGASVDFMTFHRKYYRDPSRNFRVLFDEYDAQYWARYYELRSRGESDSAGRELSLGLTPAPIHHSLYFPQSSVWSGYPQMIREGEVDNLWLRLFR